MSHMTDTSTFKNRVLIVIHERIQRHSQVRHSALVLELAIATLEFVLLPISEMESAHAANLADECLQIDSLWEGEHSL